MKTFRLIASSITFVGLILLGFVFYEFFTGDLAGKFYTEPMVDPSMHLPSLFLALPVPLHIIFIGLIIQKKFLSEQMSKFAKVGIVSSGFWLGIAMLVKMGAIG